MGWNESQYNFISLPERSRAVIVNSNYSTAINSSFECCSLVTSADIDIVANTYVSIENTLYVLNGIVNIRDKGSLVMVKDTVGGVSGNGLISTNPPFSQIITHKTTVGLDAYTDYVFWSTPLANVPINNTTNTAGKSINVPVAAIFPIFAAA